MAAPPGKKNNPEAKILLAQKLAFGLQPHQAAINIVDLFLHIGDFGRTLLFKACGGCALTDRFNRSDKSLTCGDERLHNHAS